MTINQLAALLRDRQRDRGLLLLVDYDGTLVELAPRPELARPTPELLDLLGRLAARPDYRVVVISGRPLADLRAILPIPGLNYLGSHGAERLMRTDTWSLPPEAEKSLGLGELKQHLLARLPEMNGCWLETKPFGLALHYRQAGPEAEACLRESLEPWLAQEAGKGHCRLMWGNKVLEILPTAVGKGRAIQELLLLPEFIGWFPLYLGDDQGDEGAFRVLEGKGLTIRVGAAGAATAAAHSLPHPAAVRQFLGLLADSE